MNNKIPLIFTALIISFNSVAEYSDELYQNQNLFINQVILTTVVIVIILMVISWIVWKNHRNKQDKIEAEKRYAKGIKKFNESVDLMANMTKEQIATAVGLSERIVVTLLMSKKIKCLDFDGTISIEERSRLAKELKVIGRLSPEIICQFRQIKGRVFKKTNAIQVEYQSNNTNITAAILSGTTITKRMVTQLHCQNCYTTWSVMAPNNWN